MPKIKVNDINLYYEIQGSGDPLVLIGGFTANRLNWTNLTDNFMHDFQVLMIENRGAGESDVPDYDYTVEMMADDVIEVVKALKLGPAHFLGNSMGGAIVQTIAYKYPELTKSAIICHSFMRADLRLRLWTEQNLGMMEAGIDAEKWINTSLISVFSLDFLSKEGNYQQLKKLRLANPFPMTIPAYRHQKHALFTFDSSSWVGKIKCPTLVVAGGEDLLADAREGEEIANKISGAKYYCFPRVGHISHIEERDAFVKLVRDFIRNI
jgi:3-oxoadipate enol-lactonase